MTLPGMAGINFLKDWSLYHRLIYIFSFIVSTRIQSEPEQIILRARVSVKFHLNSFTISFRHQPPFTLFRVESEELLNITKQHKKRNETI